METQGTLEIFHAAALPKRDERLTRAERLRTRRDFSRVYAEGKRYSSSLFTLFVRATEQPKSRLGIAVSRRVGTAVERNRAKRLIREAFRKNKWRLPGSFDLVVNVKEAIRQADYGTVEAELVKLIEQLRHKLSESAAPQADRTIGRSGSETK